MKRTAPLAIGLAGLALAAPAALAASTDQQITTAANAGATWIDSQQAGDGTFNPGFSSFDPTATALAAAGRHAADVRPGNSATPSLQDVLQSILSDPGNASHPTDVGGFENALLSAYSAGIDPSRVSASENLGADLAGTYSGGYFGDPTAPFVGFGNTVFGVLALTRLPAPGFLIDRSVQVIRANQHDDGGWNYDQSITAETQDDPSGVDLTGATLAALCDSGVSASDPTVEDGIDYLRGRYVAASGAIVGAGQFDSANANATAWAISGLKACGVNPQGAGFNGAKTPVDYLRSLQNTAAGADNGSFLYSNPPPSFAPGPDLPSSRDAVRALAGASFAADPPARAVAGQPRRLAPPVVDAGTAVPVSLAVDDGVGGITYCSVTIPSGSSLAQLLATADASSKPSGCATGGAFTGGQLSALNGKSGTWAISTDSSADQVAAGQTVSFGDLVALRRTSSAVPATPAGSVASTPVPAAVQARSTPSATTAKSLRFSAKKRTVTVPVSCALDNRSCQGTVYIVDGKTTLGRRPFTIGGGKTTKLGVKLYAKPLKRLGKRKKVRVNVFSRDGSGVASTSSHIVTFTRGS